MYYLLVSTLQNDCLKTAELDVFVDLLLDLGDFHTALQYDLDTYLYLMTKQACESKNIINL